MTKLVKYTLVSILQGYLAELNGEGRNSYYLDSE